VTSAEDVRSFVLAELEPALEDAGIATDDVADDLDLIDARIIDSLGMLEVIASVEAHFGLEVDFEELDPELLSAIGPFSRFVAAEAAKAD